MLFSSFYDRIHVFACKVKHCNRLSFLKVNRRRSHNVLRAGYSDKHHMLGFFDAADALFSQATHRPCVVRTLLHIHVQFQKSADFVDLCS